MSFVTVGLFSRPLTLRDVGPTLRCLLKAFFIWREASRVCWKMVKLENGMF